MMISNDHEAAHYAVSTSTQLPRPSQGKLLMWVYRWRYRVKVQFTLEQATKAQRGSRGIAVLFL
jgi:hypothetical protein